MKLYSFYLLVISLFISPLLQAQDLEPEVRGDSLIYHLDISELPVNYTGKKRMAMAINGRIPGPVLRFKEGKHAVIHVTNKMEVETSVHWHGLLLPNYQDGVPYLTTPPIRPGETLTYDFPLIQSGTYWYHSHTGLQEQKGVYGSIVVEPHHQMLEYDYDLVLVLSDWTDANPHRILKNLKRHNEWYGVRLRNAPSLYHALKSGTLGSTFKLWASQMPGMHISDIPYEAYLINGKREVVYDHFEAGSKIRLRVINAAASSYYWVNIGGGHLNIVSADGIDVEPVHSEKVLIGLAETYDFMVEVQEGKSLEFQATSQDVMGSASAFIGSGERVYAEDIPFPDYQEMGARMAGMHGGGGHDMSLEGEEKGVFSSYKAQSGSDTSGPMEMMDHSAHDMMNDTAAVDEHAGHDMGTMNMQDIEKEMDMGAETDSSSGEKMVNMNMEMDHSMHMSSDPVDPMIMWDVGYNNSILKAKKPTDFAEGGYVRYLTFNLTGNMWRYTWSINGKTLSETDKVKIKKGEVVRVTLNNTTMMHHPMHLHGHFFRVLNGQGAYSPLKHTVDVPPMSRVTIEFDANEEKDWFFHCHLLYHMKSGMSRVFSYEGSERDQRLAPYPVGTLYNTDRSYYYWGTATGSSHMGGLSLVATNTRNQFNLMAEYGWNENYEVIADYERFVGDYFRLYAGGRAENETSHIFDQDALTARVGMRYLLLFVLDTDISIDHLLRPEVGFNSHIPVTRRLLATGHFEWQSDVGLAKDLPAGKSYESEITYTAGFEFMLNEFFSMVGNYDNRFGWGGGLSLRF